MFRGMAWLAKTVAAGLIISFLSIWTTGYIVTSYVEALLKQYELPLEAPPMSMSGVWGKLWGADPLLAQGVAEPGDSGEQGGRETAAGEDEAEEVMGGMGETPPVKAGTPSGDGDVSGTPAEGSVAEGGMEGVPPDGGAAPPNPDDHGRMADGTETAVTTDELLGAKERMSEADKEQIFQMLMLYMPAEALQQISLYMEDGLTEAELTNIQQIMAQHLDTQQYNEMMEILKKY